LNPRVWGIRWQAGRLLCSERVNMTKQIQRGLMAVGAFALTSPAFAAIDVTAVTGGITEAGTALLAVIGGLLAMSVLILGIGKVYAFVKRRAGA
jgi:hypothetical protein